MVKSSPNTMVGLVTFNNEVVLLGDGSQQPVVITGDRLYNASSVVEIASQSAPQLLSQPVKLAGGALIDKFSRIQEKG
jgi:hypothetical protein